MEIAGRLSAARALALVGASLTLASCAVATPATLTSAQSAATPVNSIEFASQEEERGMRAQFKTALRSAFSGQGVGVAAGAPYLAEFTVSQRPAELALQDVTGDDANAEAPKSDFEPRWFHSCKPDRVSASLVIYAKASGTLHSKAQGEFVGCPGDTAQLDDLAELLAARALQN